MSINTKALLEQFKAELRQAADPLEIEKGKRFFKEEIRLLGVKVPATKRLAEKYFALIRPVNKATVFSMCEELFKSGIMEESWVACEWCYAIRDEYAESDFAVFEMWLEKYVNNWATCDTLCNHSLGYLLELYPYLTEKTLAWTTSPVRWLKRGAAVSYIIPARKGMFLETIFATAEALLIDEDDLVQKGYGWALKAASEAHRDRVYDFVTARYKVMPRTAFRYALEKMPADMRKRAMALR